MKRGQNQTYEKGMKNINLNSFQILMLFYSPHRSEIVNNVYRYIIVLDLNLISLFSGENKPVRY